MKKHILTILVAILCFHMQAIAQQELTYDNHNDNELVTEAYIYKYLKDGGYNPIDKAYEDIKAVMFYDKLSEGLIQFGVNYESGHISIVQFVSDRDNTGNLQRVDFRPLGAESVYVMAHTIMMTTSMVQVFYDIDDGSLQFAIELPLMRMGEFKLYLNKCLENIVSARRFLERFLKLTLENTKQ